MPKLASAAQMNTRGITKQLILNVQLRRLLVELLIMARNLTPSEDFADKSKSISIREGERAFKERNSKTKKNLLKDLKI